MLRRFLGYTISGGVIASAHIAYAHADTSVRNEHTQRASSASSLPERVPYLLIGAGTASYYAALTIRARDPSAKVLIVGGENEAPYSRSPLSKELWWYGDNNVAENLQYVGYRRRKKDVYYEAAGFYVEPQDWKQFEHGCVSLVKNCRVTHIDTAQKRAILDTGEAIAFDKCLVATGGDVVASTRANKLLGSRPRISAPLDSDELRGRVHTLKTTADFRRLDAIARSSTAIAIVGGGYTTAELTYSLLGYFKSVNKLQIIDIFAEDELLAAVLPGYLREDATRELFKTGARVLNGCKIESATRTDDDRVRLVVRRKDGSKEAVIVDHILDATATQPNVDLAVASELGLDKMNGGILLDEHMRAAPDIYGAGDVGAFKDPLLGRRRVEHIEHAEISGRVAGENMTGGNRSLPRQPSWRGFVSPNAKFLAVGKVDATLKTTLVSAQKDPEEDEKLRAIAFYLEADKIVGILLYNLPESSVIIARAVLERQAGPEAIADIAKLFYLHEVGEAKSEAAEPAETPEKPKEADAAAHSLSTDADVALAHPDAA